MKTRLQTALQGAELEEMSARLRTLEELCARLKRQYAEADAQRRRAAEFNEALVEQARAASADHLRQHERLAAEQHRKLLDKDARIAHLERQVHQHFDY